MPIGDVSEELEIVGIFPDEPETAPRPSKEDPEKFFTENAFRVIYQTNNFLLPQLKPSLKVATF